MGIIAHRGAIASSMPSVLPGTHLYYFGAENVSFSSARNSSCTMTEDAGSVTIHNTAAFGECSWATDLTVDLTSYTTLTVDWEDAGNWTASGNNTVALCVGTSRTAFLDTYTAAISHSTTFSRVTEALDVTALNSTYYVRFQGANNISGRSFTTTLYRITLT